ncbi:MAG: hypothetical protein U0Y68_21935 [Blastocatellia bacterium]
MFNPNSPNNPDANPDFGEEVLREPIETFHEGAPTELRLGGGALKALQELFVKLLPGDAEVRANKTGKPASPPGTDATSAPSLRVGDLVADEPVPKFPLPPPPTSPFAAIIDLANRPLDEIYRRAKLPPTSCSIDDLGKLMENPVLLNQPLNIKVVAVTVAFSAKGITAEEPVIDAMRRERVMEAYQSMLIERVATTEERNTAKIRQLMKELEEFTRRKQNEMNALKTEIAETKKQAAEFATRRDVEEKRMAELITPFLEEKPNTASFGNAS